MSAIPNPGWNTTAYQSDHSNGSNYGYTSEPGWCIPFIVLFALSGTVHAIQAYLSKVLGHLPHPLHRCTHRSHRLVGTRMVQAKRHPRRSFSYADRDVSLDLHTFFSLISCAAGGLLTDASIFRLIMAPVFFSAYDYTFLGGAISHLGPQYSVLRPQFYLFVFLIDDTIACILQAVGGGLASGSAATGSPTDTSTNIMVAGIIFQLVSMVVFVGLGFDFVIRASTRRPYAFRLRQISLAAAKKNGNEKTIGSGRQEDNTAMEGDAAEVFQGERENLTRWWIMSSGAMISSIMIIIRGVYRSAEFSQGWSGYIITNQRFIGLDCVPMFIAVAVFNIIHPMFLLPKKTSWKGYH